MPLPTRRTLAVVVHDVCPSHWAACERLLRSVRAIEASLPITYLVVPSYHGQPLLDQAGVASPDSAACARAMTRSLDESVARGDDLALHGYTHREDALPAGPFGGLLGRWQTAGAGEFAALDDVSAARRLSAGRAWFARRGWPLHGFVPPGWLLGPAARDAVDHSGFEYTCDSSRLIALPVIDARGHARPASALHSHSLVYSTRSAYRRAVSCLWNGASAYAERDSALLRFDLHPNDADHPAVRRSWMRLLERSLEHRTPVTLRAASSSLRADTEASALRAEVAGEVSNQAAHGGHASSEPPPVVRPVKVRASTSLGSP